MGEPTQLEALAAEVKATATDVKKILAHIGGGYDEHGQHYPGLSYRVTRVETVLAWFGGLGTAVLLAFAGAGLTGHLNIIIR